jgi:hypothetical protein
MVHSKAVLDESLDQSLHPTGRHVASELPMESKDSLRVWWLCNDYMKALVFEGSNDTADRDVVEMRDRRMILTHTVTATTGSSMT